MSNSKTVLITGGAGFIGSNLALAMLKAGYQVKIFDNFYTGKKSNLSDIISDIELVEGDITDEAVVNEAVKNVDYISHLAAIPAVPRSIDDPILTSRVNIMGLVNVLTAAKNAKVKRLVFASSSSVYGDSEALSKHEELRAKPKSPYAINKYAGEKFCQVFHDLYGLETISLRYFNVFGPKQDPYSNYSAVIPLFIKAFRNNEQPIIYGDGEQARDFTYVDNVVRANIMAIEADKTSGEVMNIACGQKISLNELVRELKNIFNKDINPIYRPNRIGDVRYSLADISKAKELIGYQPGVTFNEGLQKTVDWYLNN